MKLNKPRKTKFWFDPIRRLTTTMLKTPKLFVRFSSSDLISGQ